MHCIAQARVSLFVSTEQRTNVAENMYKSLINAMQFMLYCFLNSELLKPNFELVYTSYLLTEIFSERELKFMFAICHRPSVCLSVVCLSVCNVRAPYSDD